MIITTTAYNLCSNDRAKSQEVKAIKVIFKKTSHDYYFSGLPISLQGRCKKMVARINEVWLKNAKPRP